MLACDVNVSSVHSVKKDRGAVKKEMLIYNSYVIQFRVFFSAR